MQGGQFWYIQQKLINIATTRGYAYIERSVVQKREREREEGYSLITPRSHSKPPESTGTNTATTWTPGIRILQIFIFWTNDFHPALYPGRRFTRLLPAGGIIGSDVSEHLLWYDRFEAYRSWVSRLLVGLVFYKHRTQEVCIMGGISIFERSFGGFSLFRLLWKQARTMNVERNDGEIRTFSLASLLCLASLSNCPSTLNAGTTPALPVRWSLTTGSFNVIGGDTRKEKTTTYAKRIR